MSSVRNRNNNRGGGRNRNSSNTNNSRNKNNRRNNSNRNNNSDDDDNIIPIGRRVFCKSNSSAVKLSKQISMAALPDSIQGFPVRVYAARADATNVAVKATAIATARLANMKQDDDDEAMDLVCIPYFRENRNEVSLHVIDLDTIKQSAIFTTRTSDFNIGAKTDIKTSAGAIAGSARNKESVVLISIGPVAVFNAIRSVAVAREYLKGRGDDIDLFVKVQFTEVRLDDKEEDTTAVKLTCFLHKGLIELDEDGDDA
mmetsp:Transcript_5065/g.5371  ORF Transcript_5065/g.5371 Transcript_5065/m.5371 type:complete len:257 (+) Transcript_5065:74-844(+)